MNYNTPRLTREFTSLKTLGSQVKFRKNKFSTLRSLGVCEHLE